MSGIPGSGLAKGLGVTLRALTRRSVTQQYPDVAPELPPRSRGVIALLEENCTVCMLCARECPDWCIYIDSSKETLPAPEGGRPRVRNVLDRFAIDFSLCMYCGICIEVCPFDALFWSPEFEYAEYDVLDLTHEKPRLREWMWTVPPPPALDPGAAPAKELVAAEKALNQPARPAAERPPRVARPAADRPARAVTDRPSRAAGAATATDPAAPGSAALEAEPGGPSPAATVPEPAGLTAAAAAPEPARPQPGDADAAPLEPEIAQGGEADSGSVP